MAVIFKCAWKTISTTLLVLLFYWKQNGHILLAENLEVGRRVASSCSSWCFTVGHGLWIPGPQSANYSGDG